MADRFGTEFDRLFVAMLTPFKENFEVDETALRKLLRYFMQPRFTKAGGAIVINPEAGEIFQLSRQERLRNVEITMEECGGKVPVFVGVVDLKTEDAVRVAIDAKEAGANGLFLMPPVGLADITSAWDPEQYPEIFTDFAKAEVDAVDLPAIVHPTGARTTLFGAGIPVQGTLYMCRHIPNIVGWKLTYSYLGGIVIADALRTLDRHVGILRAPARFFHENLATGDFDGTVTGSFCYAMEPMIDHIEAWKAKDIEKACQIWQLGLSSLHHYIYFDPSRLHIKYKTACWLRGLIPLPFMRPPLPRPRKAEVAVLRELLQKTKLDIIPEKDSNYIVNQLTI